MSNLNEMERNFVWIVYSTDMVRTNVVLCSPHSESTIYSYVLAHSQLILLSAGQRVMILLYLNICSPIIDNENFVNLLQAYSVEATNERETKYIFAIYFERCILARLPIVRPMCIGVEQHPERQWHQRLLVTLLWKLLIALSILRYLSLPTRRSEEAS